MPDYIPGRHTMLDAPVKNSPTSGQKPFFNNITRRNINLTETMPMRRPSSSLVSANIKSLRLFRHICRMLPFILKIHELKHRVEPVQAKRYVANHFRDHATERNLATIDNLVQYGYETVYEAEMDYSNAGYLYRFVMPKHHNWRDHGINRLLENKADRINQAPNSKFLEDFYKGPKTHVH